MKKRIPIVLLSLIFQILGVSAFANEQVIWQKSENRYIKLTQDDNGQSFRNSHPITINPSHLYTLLKAINVVKNKDELSPLFSEQQQQTLAEHVSKALAISKPNQDIVFALQREERSFGGLKTSHYFIAGRFFFNDGQLNLIVGDYDRPRNRAYEMAYDPTNQDLVKYSFNLGSRNNSDSSFDADTFFALSHIRLHDQTQRKDWLQLDVQNARAATVIEHEKATPKFQAIQYEAQPVTPVENTTVKKPTPPTAPTSQPKPITSIPKTNDLLERFKTLEALKNNGLITQEEYEKKRQALLDEL